MHLRAAALALAVTCAASAGVTVGEQQGDRYTVTFRYQPVIAVQQVQLAGSFNGWNKDANPLSDADGDGVWLLELELPKGRHEYKFVVNGDQWQHDPDNPVTDPDGMNGYNSILELGTGRPSGTGTPGDGEINTEVALHDPDELAHASAVDGGTRLVLRAHVLANDVEQVRLVVSPAPREGESVLARKLVAVDGRDVYEARVSWDRAPSRVKYRFDLSDGDAEASLPGGRKRYVLRVNHAARFETPDWVRDAVFYQIFPDRFRDGDPERQPARPRRPDGKPWGIDDGYLEAWDGKPAHHNFMGGDLDGVTQKIDYLRELGVNALYLNPIFAAESNHRYDAADYETIDPALGTMDDFHELRDASRAAGMRMILDCVFNHTGDEHYAFQDCKAKGPKSKYWDWYFIDGFPVSGSPPNYKCWWGFGDLPQLATANPEVVNHLLKVSTQWLKEGAHGWRLDVPNEVDAINPDFWPEFRKVVKRQDPDSYIVGEIWTDARQWLNGTKFDAVMNYPVRSAALEFIVKGGIEGQQFARDLSRQLATYPEPALRVQFNLLGSHDTARIRTIAGGDLRKVRLAQTFLFAWPGAPVIYYGDEIGLEGGKDPDCRRTYPWNRPELIDTQTLSHVQTLGKLRAQEPALRRGTTRFLVSEAKLSAFVREPETGDAGRPVVCVLNASGSPQRVRVPLDLAGEPVSLLGPQVSRDGDALVLQLPPYGGAFVALD